MRGVYIERGKYREREKGKEETRRSSPTAISFIKCMPYHTHLSFGAVLSSA
jgi:hypothetical protein